MWTWDIILALLAVGSATGFIAGLFGVGGGTLVVPVVLWTLQLQGISSHPYRPTSRHRHILRRNGVHHLLQHVRAAQKKRHRLADCPPYDPFHDIRRTDRRGNCQIHAYPRPANLLHLIPNPYRPQNPHQLQTQSLAPPARPARSEPWSAHCSAQLRAGSASAAAHCPSPS